MTLGEKTYSYPEIDKAGASIHYQADELLVKQKAYFEHLFYSIPAALVLLDNNDCIEDFNEAFGKLFLYTLKEVKGQPINDLIVPPHLRVEAENATENVGVGETIYFESVRKRKDGNLVEVAITGRPIIAKTGQLAVLGIYQDISDRKLTEKRLRDNEARLKELNATKDKFFSIIAHDLKNPFSSLIGFSSLLSEKMREKDYAGIEKYAEIIYESSTRAMNLLMNLLEWSQAHTGKIEFNPEYLVIQALAEQEAFLLSESAKEKSIHIKINIPNSHIAYADKNMVGTVIRNLISNAVKFSHPGDVVLVSSKTDNNHLIISVEDEGVGIPENQLIKLFRIDQGFSSPGTYKEKGTGIGLILCKEFIERHGCDIWAESEEGRGSVFYFSLNTTPS
jgi:PAS domain S-box-containing protein